MSGRIVRSSRDVARDAHRYVLTIPARTVGRRTGRTQSLGASVRILRDNRDTWNLLPLLF